MNQLIIDTINFLGGVPHPWHVGSWFPDQQWNWCPLQWKHRVLAMGLQGGPYH